MGKAPKKLLDSEETHQLAEMEVPGADKEDCDCDELLCGASDKQ